MQLVICYSDSALRCTRGGKGTYEYPYPYSFENCGLRCERKSSGYGLMRTEYTVPTSDVAQRGYRYFQYITIVQLRNDLTYNGYGDVAFSEYFFPAFSLYGE